MADIVTPHMEAPARVEEPIADDDDPDADPCAGGVVGGIVGGVMSAPPPPPALPPPPPPPRNVAPTLLEAQRIAGNKNIVPDEATKRKIAQAGKDHVIVVFKLCLNTRGEPRVINLLKTSGFPDYDATIRSEMQQWRYRPYQVNGHPVPVCTAITFVYRQVPAPPPTKP